MSEVKARSLGRVMMGSCGGVVVGSCGEESWRIVMAGSYGGESWWRDYSHVAALLSVDLR